MWYDYVGINLFSGMFEIANVNVDVNILNYHRQLTWLRF